jgi:hypothetical protein
MSVQLALITSLNKDLAILIPKHKKLGNLPVSAYISYWHP